jgi:CDP-diacylglycerol--glycerol-3-phosphate 3-phosphatidyltransferase
MAVDFHPKIREHRGMNIPNALTILRISLIPILVLVFYLPVHWSYLGSAIVFSVAAITDWFDGYLARKLKQVSALGEFLDPVADKLIVAVALVLLVQAHATFWLTIPAAIIVSREIVISALREWMAELGNRTKVRVSYLGKLKTVGQMVAIALLLSQDPTLRPFGMVMWLGYLLIYIASALTLWSMIVYLRAAWDEMYYIE